MNSGDQHARSPSEVPFQKLQSWRYLQFTENRSLGKRAGCGVRRHGCCGLSPQAKYRQAGDQDYVLRHRRAHARIIDGNPFHPRNSCVYRQLLGWRAFGLAFSVRTDSRSTQRGPLTLKAIRHLGERRHALVQNATSRMALRVLAAETFMP